MSIVHLVRHGHVHNPDRVLYGRAPGFRLSSAGEDMAVAVAKFFRSTEADVGRIVASPLIRAQQTAAPIAEAFGLDIHTDDRVIEASNDFAGQRIGGVAHYLHPRHWWRLRNPWKPSWGEPYATQRARMIAAITDAAAACPHQETVIVSHQLPIWVARRSLEGGSLLHDPRRRQCALASVTSVAVEPEGMRVVAYQEPASAIEVPA